MNCQDVLELMQNYVDHEHTSAEYAAISEHLHGCASCTAIFERLKHLSNELEQLPKVVPPFSIVDAILPKLERMSLLHQPTWQERLKERIPYKTLGSLAAGIVLVIVLLNSHWPGSLNSAEERAFDTATKKTSMAAVSPTSQEPDKIETKFTAAITPTPVPQTEVQATETETPAAYKPASGETPKPAEVVQQAKADITKSKTANNDVTHTTKIDNSKSRESTPAPKSVKSTPTPAVTQKPATLTLEPESPKPAATATASPVLTMDAEQFPSPDGSYIAYVQSNEASKQLMVVNKQLDPVFISMEKEVDQISNIVWSDDSKVVKYDTVTAGITRHFSVDVAKLTETEQ